MVKISELLIPVALFPATTTSQRVSFHTINRKTGNQVRRQFIDEETEQPVEKENQVKGYALSQSEYVVLKPKEIEEAIPESDKTIHVKAFIPCAEVDTVYLDRPYFLTPSGSIANEGFALMREGMRRTKVAALGSAVLFRRIRTLLLYPQGPLLIAHMLHFSYEVRPASEVFEHIPELKIEGEMLELAKHIIKTKCGKFDPREFDDRYEEALAALVRAKIAGRGFKAPKPPKETRGRDLMDALRKSAEAAGEPPPNAKAGKRKTEATNRRKAS